MAQKRGAALQQHIIKTASRLYIERGSQKTRTRDIATEAECSIASVHAHFPTKDELIAEVIRQELKDIDKTVPKPSGDFRADLTLLARNYYEFYQNSLVLLFVLPDIYRSPELKKILHEEQDATVAKLAYLYGSHRDRDEWTPIISEQNLDLDGLVDKIAVFLSAIFARMLWHHVGLVRGDFDPEEYVALFLDGYSNPAKRPGRKGENKS